MLQIPVLRCIKSAAIAAICLILGASCAIGGAPSRTQELLRALPLRFEENRGQFTAGVRFVEHNQQGAVAFSAGGVSYQVGSKSVGVRLTGGAAEPEGAMPLAVRSNYYGSQDQSKWVTGARSFERVLYRQLLPGVDLTYYGQSGKLEYDLTLAPGVSVDQLRFSIHGAERVSIGDFGNLALQTADGSVVWHRPVAYQISNGKRKLISAGYRLLSKTGEVGFALGNYNHALPLVIDPVVTFSRLLSGDGKEEAAGIAIDSQGNTFIAGMTTSTLFEGVFLGPSAQRILVLKLSPTGELLATTGLTGGQKNVQGLAVDAAGNAYLTGFAYAPFLTTPGAFRQGDSSIRNSQAFAVKLNGADLSLAYATLLRPEYTSSQGIVADASGAVYLAGEATNQLNQKIFLTRLNAAGNSIDYDYVFGGSSSDLAVALARDQNGDFYIAGNTNSPDFPFTRQITSVQPQLPVTMPFVARIATGAHSLTYATLLGGSSNAAAISLAVQNGQAYVGGTVSLPGDNPNNSIPASAVPFPASFFGPPPTEQGQYGWVMRLSAAGDRFDYSKFLDLGETTSLAVDAQSQVWAAVSGYGKYRVFQISSGGDRLTNAFDLREPAPLNQAPSPNGPPTFLALDGQSNLWAAATVAAAPSFLDHIFVAKLPAAQPQANLILTLGASTAFTSPGQIVTFTAEIRNLGPQDAENVVLDLTGAQPILNQSCTALPDGICDPSLTFVTFARIPAGQSRLVTFTSAVSGSGAANSSVARYAARVRTTTSNPSFSARAATADIVVSSVRITFVASPAAAQVQFQSGGQTGFGSLSVQALPGSQLSVSAQLAIASDQARFVFDHWSDGVTDNPRTLNAGTQDRTLTAFFRQYTVVTTSPASIEFDLTAGSGSSQQAIVLRSTDPSTFAVAPPDVPWLNVSSPQFVLGGGDSSAVLTLTANPAGLPPGSYSTVLKVTANAIGTATVLPSTQNVPVTLKVVGSLATYSFRWQTDASRLAYPPGTFGAARTIAVLDGFPDGVKRALMVQNKLFGDIGQGVALVPVSLPASASKNAPAYTLAGLKALDAAVGDVNGDGLLDVVTISNAGVYVALRHSDGSFAYEGAQQVSPPIYPVDFQAQSITLADVDGDGKLDAIVTGLNYDRLIIYRGNGDGTFQPHTPAVFTKRFPYAVSAGDLNGDGLADIVTANGSGSISVFLGQTNAIPLSFATLPVSGSTRTVKLADVNGDGKLDLLYATVGDTTGHNVVSVRLGAGDGTFGPESSYPVDYFPTEFQVVDVNRDGKPDVLVMGSNDLLLNQGNGTFAPSIPLAVGIASYFAFIADVNGDGNPDLITDPDYPRVYAGDGTGKFNTPPSFAGGADGVILTPDLNGDGFPDVVASSNIDPVLQVTLSTGRGVYAPPVAYPVAFAQNRVISQDLNGDGFPDLIAFGPSYPQYSGPLAPTFLTIMLNDRKGGFLPGPSVPPELGAIAVTAADMNGDGRKDLIIGTLDRGLIVLLASANGAYPSLLRTELGARPIFVDTADINRDGKLDVVVVLENHHLLTFFGQGDGSLSAPVDTLDPDPQAPVTSLTAATLGDANYDGQPDLIIGRDIAQADTDHPANHVHVLLGKADGSFVQSTKEVESKEYVRTLMLADLDGDGILDLFATQYPATILIYHGNRDGSFDPPNVQIGGGESAGIGVAVADILQAGVPNLLIHIAPRVIGVYSADRQTTATSIVHPGFADGSPEPIIRGVPLTVVAYVGSVGAAGSASRVVTGTVVFRNGQTVLGSAGVNSLNGQVYFTFIPDGTTLALSAEYLGDLTNMGSIGYDTPAAVRDPFQVSPASASINLDRLGSGSQTLQITGDVTGVVARSAPVTAGTPDPVLLQPLLVSMTPLGASLHIEVSIDVSRLNSQSYFSREVQLVSGGGQILLRIPVNIYVSNVGPVFSPAAANVGAAGGSGSFQVLGGQSLIPFVSVNVNWIHVTIDTGVIGNQTIRYVVDPNPAAISRSGAISSGNLTFLVNQSGINGLQVGVSSLTFDSAVGNIAPIVQTIPVTSAGQAIQITASATSSGSWLSVTPNTTGTPALLQVQADPAKLSPGTYQGQITIDQTPSNGAPQVVNVTLTVRAPALHLSGGAVVFQRTGSSPIADQQVNLSSNGTPVHYTTSVATTSGGNWLSVGATNGVTPGPLTLSANGTGLGAGDYQGTVTLTSSDARSNLVIPVTLHVPSLALAVGDAPLSAAAQTALGSGVLTYTASGSAISDTFRIDSLTGAPTTFNATIVAPGLLSGGTWLTVSPQFGTTPGTLTVKADPKGLAAGTYRLRVLVTAQSDDNPLQLDVVLVVK